MNKRTLHLPNALSLFLPLALTACGGNVIFSSSEGTGGQSSTAASIDGDDGPFTDATVGATTSGAAICDGLAWGRCVGTPGCVPVFDDQCCPTCNPGACADCVDWQYIGCKTQSEACNGGLPCGTPDKAVCESVPHQCDQGPCEFQLGCEVFKCSLDGAPCPDQCLEVSAGICDAMCDSTPPNCPEGTTAASDGFCWTGLCVPFEVCAMGL